MAASGAVSGERLGLAIQLTGVDAKFLAPFDVTDPFNGDLRLEGYLCQRPDHRYGALAITHVGGEAAPQVIYATPKLQYPFGRDGRFHFPPIHRAVLYEKLDGTNVLAYRYRDARGSSFLTYKLRLSAVLRNSRWGPFLDFWGELLARYPAVPHLVDANRCHISFEMYGARNPHLISYDAGLDLAVLFGVQPADARIIAPFELSLLGAPAAPWVGELRAGEDPLARYARIREEMEARNRPAADERLAGMEGVVWYVVEANGRLTLWKCKPESVEQIHWAAGINKQAVIATCWNCLETSDQLTYGAVLPLLLEEYPSEEIERYRPVIDACIAEVRAAYEYKERVRAAYARLGLSIHTEKATVMRALANIFPRHEMKKVYAILAAEPIPAAADPAG